MLGALAGVAEGFRVALGRGDPDTLSYLTGLAFAGGEVCGILGMRALKIAGRGMAAGVVFGVMLLAGVAQMVLEAFGLITGNPADPLPGLVGMVILVGALVIGIMALRTGTWSGWRAYVPFALPLAIVLTIVAAIAGAMLGLILAAAAWLIIGYVVYSSPAEPSFEAIGAQA
jgi:hypothetical protein